MTYAKVLSSSDLLTINGGNRGAEVGAITGAIWCIKCGSQRSKTRRYLRSQRGSRNLLGKYFFGGLGGWHFDAYGASYLAVTEIGGLASPKS